MENNSLKLGLIIISDRAVDGSRPDATMPLVRSWCTAHSYELVFHTLVPDEAEAIRDVLRTAVDRGDLDLVITSGGTGLAKRDITPEITKEFIDQPTPGIDEFLRAKGLEQTPFSILSRGVSGLAGGRLIINMPGRSQAVIENLEWLLPVLHHALRVSRGPVDDGEHRNG